MTNIDPKVAEEMEKREVENRARKFLDEYRKLCHQYGMELSVERPNFVIIESSYEGDKIQSDIGTK